MTSESVKFDRAADYYDRTRGFPPGEELPIAHLIAQAGRFSEASRVLEIGVGTGRIAIPVSPYIGSYVGLDLSRPMMDKLRDKQSGQPIYLAEGDATRLPLPDSAFDGAVVCHVFHLIPNWQAALAELERTLRPDAPLVHIWSGDTETFQPLWDAWNAALPEKSNLDYGVSWRKQPNFLVDEGWQPQGEVLTHSYPMETTIDQFLSILKGRIWSACWRYTDDELAQGIAAMEAVIPSAYPERDKPVIRTTTVYVGAYARPHRS